MTFKTAENLVNGVFQQLHVNWSVEVTLGDTDKSPPTTLQRIPFSTMLGIMNINVWFPYD
jgi:hypothetical protein